MDDIAKNLLIKSIRMAEGTPAGAAHFGFMGVDESGTYKFHMTGHTHIVRYYITSDAIRLVIKFSDISEVENIIKKAIEEFSDLEKNCSYCSQ